VGDEKLDLIEGESVEGQGLFDHLGHLRDRHPEDLSASHLHPCDAFIDHLVRYVGLLTDVPDVKLQCIRVTAVRVKVRGEDAALRVFRWPDDYSACAVSEKNGHVSAFFCIAEGTRMHLGAHHEDPFVHPDSDKCIRHGKAVDESTALVSDVEAPHFGHPEFLLEIAGRSREVMVRAQCGKNDEVQLLGLHLGVVERLFCCLECQVGAVDALVGVTPLDDS